MAAAVLGRETVFRLLVRELGGLTLLDGPMLGWLDLAECRAAAARVADFTPDDDTGSPTPGRSMPTRWIGGSEDLW